MKWRRGAAHPAQVSRRLWARPTALALVCALAACDAPEEAPPRNAPAQALPSTTLLAHLPADRAGEPRDWPTLAEAAAEGLQGAILHRAEGALALELPHDRFAAKLLTAPGLTGRGALEDGMAVVVGSGFVAELRSLQPLGLLQVDGAIASAVSMHGYTRILGMRSGDLAAVGRGDYHRGLFESALQAGPGIIERGQIAIRPRERNLPAYFRAFVGVCANASIAGVTTAPMHLYDLGLSLLGLFEAAALDCSEVVNLAGDREALLGIRGASRTFIAGHADTGKATLIGFGALPPNPGAETFPSAAP